MKKFQRIVCIILCITIVLSTVICGLIAVKAAPGDTTVPNVTSDSLYSPDILSSDIEDTSQDVSQNELPTENTTTEQNGQNETENKKSYNVTLSLTGLENFKNVDIGDITITLKSLQTGVTSDLVFLSKKEYTCVGVIPSGTYEVSFKSETNGNEIVLGTKKIDLRNEVPVIKIEVSDIKTSIVSSPGNWWSDFIKNNMLYMFILVVLCVAYIIVKKKQEIKMTKEQ